MKLPDHVYSTCLISCFFTNAGALSQKSNLFFSDEILALAETLNDKLMAFRTLVDIADVVCTSVSYQGLLYCCNNAYRSWSRSVK